MTAGWYERERAETLHATLSASPTEAAVFDGSSGETDIITVTGGMLGCMLISGKTAAGGKVAAVVDLLDNFEPVAFGFASNQVARRPT